MQSMIPGWYGKIPSLGDFVCRRLPSQFVSQWDNWLQHGLTNSQISLGPDWLSAYLNAPVWRFLLLPGIIDNQTWTGLIMPSIDKVGRHFPLTVAIPIDHFSSLTNDMSSANKWHTAIENAMLATLDTNFPAEQFETALANFPIPNLLNNDDTIPGGHSLINWLQHSSSPHSINMPTLEALEKFFASAGQNILSNQLEGTSFWWTFMESNDNARLCWFKGLPPAEQFTNFLKYTLND